ncbi:MAG: OmpH family outer membrane protein [Gemmatimonadaceae bacterium]
MRKFFTTGVCTLLLAASAVSAQAQAVPKFAYVNSQQLFQVVPGRVEAAAQLAKEGAAAQEIFKAMEDTITKLNDAYEKEQVMLTKAEKLKARKDKETAFNERAEKIRAQLDERQGELQQPLQELMQKVLEDYRTEFGYTMIFDVASGQGIAAVDKNLDITDKVSARLAKMTAPKAAAAGSATKAPAGPAVAPAGLTKKPPTK